MSCRTKDIVPNFCNGFAVKASASKTADLGSIAVFHVDLLQYGVTLVSSKLVLQLLPCQAHGVTGSVQGLVGPVSVDCDRVRRKV